MGLTNGAHAPERVVLVGLVLPDTTRTVAEEHLEELAKLVETAGGEVVDRVLQERRSPDSATWIGRGKAEEVRDIAQSKNVSLVVFDDDLSPAQARNLEETIGAKIVDRSGLILDIFARRARSRESRTQVELAQLNYLLPRLTRQWSHLSRQAGGIGTRGVGETQLELDRRMTRTRIAKLKAELAKIEQTRETQRKSRSSAFTVALVGYTNAGKSTLFNQLTRGGAEAVDRLFATLDAKLQRMHFEMPRETVVIDTVGFIRKLPHHLVASFRSTMEEAVSADLVLHVINISHPHVDQQREVGMSVLRDLGVDESKVIEVYNKVDCLDGQILFETGNAVTVSALTGTGIDKLVEAIRERELAEGETLHLGIPASESRAVARLHETSTVYDQWVTGDVMHYTVWVPKELSHEFSDYILPPDELRQIAG